MIQRIQSVYLLAVALLMTVFMCNPVGSVIGAGSEISEFGNLCISLPDGTKDYAPWALFALLLVSALVALVTIFLYKKRMLQIRFTLFNSILLIGYYVVLGVFVATTLAEEDTFSPSWQVCFPFIGIVLNWLAIRAIGKDEVLVRAYDRLR